MQGFVLPALPLDAPPQGFDLPGVPPLFHRNLLRLAERVDPEVVGPPQALGVIVASGYGYTRPDGVGVIPIGALGP